MTTVTHGSITTAVAGTIVGGSEREQRDREREDHIRAVARLTERNRAHLDLIGDLFHRLSRDADGEPLRILCQGAICQIQSYCQTLGVDPRTLGKRAIAEIKAKEKRQQAHDLRVQACALETEAQEFEREL